MKNFEKKSLQDFQSEKLTAGMKSKQKQKEEVEEEERVKKTIRDWL